MLFLPNLQVRAGNYQFPFGNFEVTSSWEDLTDKAKVELPLMNFQGKAVTNNEYQRIFKRGTPINIVAGYDDAMDEIFNGYIYTVKPGEKLIFECQDAMYLFKLKTVTHSYAHATLKQILNDICPIPFEADNISIGAYRINKQTASQVLQTLKEDYGIYSYVRSGKLYCGLPYRVEGRQKIRLPFQSGIVLEHGSLEFTSSEDTPTKIKAISLQENGKSKIVVDNIGDAEGREITLHKSGLSKAELEQWAKRQLEQIKFTGYKGEITTLASPRIRHGDVVVLEDDICPDHNGSYLIKRVVTKSDDKDSLVQIIHLDRKLA